MINQKIAAKFSKFENAIILEAKHNKDLIRIKNLAKQIWNEHYEHILDKNQIKYMLTKFQTVHNLKKQILEERYRYYLIKVNKFYVGYFAIKITDDKLFISKLYIKINYRKKNYGKEMLIFIENLAIVNNCKLIYLTINKKNLNSINFYKKMNFIITKSIIIDIGGGFIMDDYLMEKIAASSFLVKKN